MPQHWINSYGINISVVYLICQCYCLQCWYFFKLENYDCELAKLVLITLLQIDWISWIEEVKKFFHFPLCYSNTE